MDTRAHKRAAAVVAGGLVLLAACGGSRDGAAGSGDDGCDPGITDGSVHLGSSSLQSGPGAVYKVLPESSAAYFDDINTAGGVKMGDGKKRKIEFTSVDDAGDPARSVQNTRQLIEKDGVFAVFQMVGTASVLAVIDYTTKKGVPLVLSATGSDELRAKSVEGAGISLSAFPTTTFEIAANVQRMQEIAPQGKIAVLYPNDGLGKGSLAVLKKAVEGTDLSIVAEESFETTAATVDSQVTKLKSSGADVLYNFGAGALVTQSLKKAQELGWNPDKFVISAASDTKSIVNPAGPKAGDKLHSVAWTYDVASPANHSKPGVKKWREFAAGHAGIDETNQIAAIGYQNAQLMVKLLEETPSCKRSDLLETAQSLSGITTDLGVEGVTFGASKADPSSVSSLATMTFEGDQWVYGDVISADDL